jgi:hypothetical protein
MIKKFGGYKTITNLATQSEMKNIKNIAVTLPLSVPLFGLPL